MLRSPEVSEFASKLERTYLAKATARWTETISQSTISLLVFSLLPLGIKGLTYSEILVKRWNSHRHNTYTYKININNLNGTVPPTLPFLRA